MANQNLLTVFSKVFMSEQFYYAPSAVVPTTGLPISSVYCFLAKVDPWSDNNNPPAPTEDVKSLKNVFKNIFVTKQVYSGDITPVLPRVDWTSGVTYDYYRDDVDMLAVDSIGNRVYNFYVKNQYDQVFKCLWNNNGQPSTIEPYFQPGQYNTNNIFQSTDGYKWKYIFTVDIGSKVKFMDNQWIPVPIGNYSPNPNLYTPGVGDIEVINVLNGGSGYDAANSPITITVTGDGTGANGYATVVNGSINDIIVTNTGSNYTYANVSITSANGSGAIAIAPTSPIGGHGSDPTSELGATSVMLSCQFNGSESGYIPTDITYYQVGLLLSPASLSSSPNPANGAIYKTTTDIIVAAGNGLFQSDEIVFQGTSLQTATFTATVLSFDPTNNILHIINKTGNLITNAQLFGNTSQTARTVLSYSLPDFIKSSGYLAYIENRSGIQRSSDGIEQVKIILSF